VATPVPDNSAMVIVAPINASPVPLSFIWPLIENLVCACAVHTGCRKKIHPELKSRDSKIEFSFFIPGDW